ncbi:aldehyde dehydrogenase [Pacificibacter sp. AS14]|uniref:aldehyde dehydrogenase n=1 Tax=Pacificibacter sp. AS14 TaxID=3135785 RepID=UPI003170FC65
MKDDIITELPDGQLYVGGVWETGTGAPITSIFPADGSINCVLKGASREDGERAIARAKTAQADPAWRALKPHERARYLYRIADGIEANIDRISRIQTRDTGKTLTETRALATSSAGTFRYFGAVLETSDEDLPTQRGTAMTLSVWDPIGLVAAITPWNSPIASDAQKVAPALAAGNAVLLKPASWSPLVSLELARIVEESGLPKGLFSVLPGAGREIGNLLVEHPDIGRVSFTGGTSTGRNLAVQAAQKLMPVSLELGGKSPTIVFEDADQDLALSGILFGVFSSTGQSCIAGARLFVQRSIYYSFLARLVAATKALKVGHPHDPTTQVSCLVHPDHRASVEEFVDDAVAAGATVLAGGKRPDDPALADGAFYLPTILGNVKNTDKICREEVFGPVLVVMPFDTEEEVIALSNDNEYALACGLWSKDFPRTMRLGRAITTGTVWVNTYKQFSASAPFGGEKDSGMAREKGRSGLRAYMVQKSVYVDLTGQPHPWAAATVAATNSES